MDPKDQNNDVPTFINSVFVVAKGGTFAGLLKMNTSVLKMEYWINRLYCFQVMVV